MCERILAQNCQKFDNFNLEFSMSHHNARYQSYKNAPVKEMSEEALLNSHFETGEEMRWRNMAGAETWITGHGLVAAGNEDAKKILLDIYNDDNSGLQL